MKYGWTCKHCGYTVHSNDKEEVKELRKAHRVNTALPPNPPRLQCRDIVPYGIVMCAPGVGNVIGRRRQIADPEVVKRTEAILAKAVAR